MKAPHVVPYQGSKRKLADDILNIISDIEIETLYEPFAGSAAITLAAAANDLAERYVIGDKFAPIPALWEMVVNTPQESADEYETVWNQQLLDGVHEPEFSYDHFMNVRQDFNREQDPIQFLYLISRCVKNAIRFNGNGEFNQSPDKRRKGTNPKTVRTNMLSASRVLQGKTEFISGDFRDIIRNATSNDIVYMDPPWQGTSTKKDTRYAFTLQIDELIEEMEDLNRRGVPFLLSFDGTCGDKSYGKELPQHLNLQKIGLNAGKSSQAILLGRDDETIESLYLSPALIQKITPVA
ncbi:DNA adenine methylase [Shewanella youngdeokensis]|uniref:site-specific DNA-methyltransferase (adenine-specific) n=1 Tax=Shewanella youngdeokensis TaxID=2999068 RepID=A0ABZ0JVZ8_9GAMM|nr:DNA adenine methylase [Shewanella sp. DAU334]